MTPERDAKGRFKKASAKGQKPAISISQPKVDILLVVPFTIILVLCVIACAYTWSEGIKERSYGLGYIHGISKGQDDGFKEGLSDGFVKGQEIGRNWTECNETENKFYSYLLFAYSLNGLDRSRVYCGRDDPNHIVEFNSEYNLFIEYDEKYGGRTSYTYNWGEL